MFKNKRIINAKSHYKLEFDIKTDDENIQKNLASKSNKILEDIIEIEDEILSNDEDGEVIETTTKFEFNLGFAKVSRSIKKIKK